MLCYFSPGTSADKTGGISLIAGCINAAHKATTSVKIVLENAAGHSNCIGDRFEDLRGIIDLVEGSAPNFLIPRPNFGQLFDDGRSI